MTTFTYTKTHSTTKLCPMCKGNKTVWNKEYHNQLVQIPCYHCGGRGRTKHQIIIDATQEVKTLKTKLSMAQATIRNLNSSK